MKTIYKEIIFSILAVLTTTSCEKQSSYNSSGADIDYSVTVQKDLLVETRGTLYNSVSELTDMSVSVECYQSGSSTALFPGVKLTRQDTRWIPDTDHAWPQGESLTFFASANVPPSSLVASISTDNIGQTLTYTEVPGNAADQQDIMLGYYCGNGGTSHTADIVMYHPLTSVIFKFGGIDGFDQDSDKIKSITINGVSASGTCSAVYDDHGKPTFSWDISDNTKSVVDEDSSGLTIAEDNSIGTPFVLLPQAVDGQMVNISMTIGGVDKKFDAKLCSMDWEAGKTNVYLLCYNPVNYDGIEIIPWNEQEEQNSFIEYLTDNWVCFSAPTEHVLGMKSCSGDNYTRYFYYSYDKQTWYRFDDYLSHEFPFGGENGALYLRGDNAFDYSIKHYGLDITFVIDREPASTPVDVEISGNVMSLVNRHFSDSDMTSTFYDDSEAKPASGVFEYLFCGCSKILTVSGQFLPSRILGDDCYEYMFNNCGGLSSVPELPATEIAGSCYHMMFDGCTSLTTAPELPATELARKCYGGMFNGCTSLETAPELPATNLAYGCYQFMFHGCTNLETSPELPATKLENLCYCQMFEGCTSLKTAPELPSTKLAFYCYHTMFSGCTSLETAPELPATNLAYGCYHSMFSGCTSLETAPELPATELAEECYCQMFTGCKNLNKVTMLANDVSATHCLFSWLSGVSLTGEFVKAKGVDLPSGSIPEGWTVTEK